jgi:hypothetical protein
MQVTGIGCLQLTKAIYNFTDTQDIRLRVGYEAFVDAKGNVSGVSSLLNACMFFMPYLLAWLVAIKKMEDSRLEHAACSKHLL